jgi:hypothetical protein
MASHFVYGLSHRASPNPRVFRVIAIPAKVPHYRNNLLML